jgi:hypothetical protein
MLASFDEKRGTCTIRKTLQNQQREVLHIHQSALWGEIEEGQMSEMSVSSVSDGESNGSERGAEVPVQTEPQTSFIKTDKSDKTDKAIQLKGEKATRDALPSGSTLRGALRPAG